MGDHVFDPDGAPVAAHDLAGDREAEAGARWCMPAGALPAIELLEHCFVFVGRHTRSLVLDPEAHALVPAACADGHRALVGVQKRVLEEVLDGARQLHEVDVYDLSLIHISEPTRLGMISYAVFCLKKKNN